VFEDPSRECAASWQRKCLPDNIVGCREGDRLLSPVDARMLPVQALRRTRIVTSALGFVGRLPRQNGNPIPRDVGKAQLL